MASDLHGYINVLKPAGWTSHDVVARLRRLSGQRRIGHTGTLDPAAVGVLPIAFGRATRTTSSSAWERKLYWADVCFGTATDTDDATGRAVATGAPGALGRETVVEALNSFIGDLQQRPPAYSAVHVGGRRAYADARRGKSSNLPTRQVRINAIEVVDWRSTRLSLLVDCQSGTYIRSIARDLGSAVGCPAHLGALVRLRVGPFDIRDSIRLESLEEAPEEEIWAPLLWQPDIASLDLDAVVFGRERAADFALGRTWLGPTPPGAKKLVRVYTDDGLFLGLAEPADGYWQPRLAIPVAEEISGSVSRS